MKINIYKTLKVYPNKDNKYLVYQYRDKAMVTQEAY